MEEKLGRPLKDNERVRFVDGDKTNLDIDNLELYETKPSKVEVKRAKLQSQIADLVAELEFLDGDVH